MEISQELGVSDMGYLFPINEPFITWLKLKFITQRGGFRDKNSLEDSLKSNPN